MWEFLQNFESFGRFPQFSQGYIPKFRDGVMSSYDCEALKMKLAVLNHVLLFPIRNVKIISSSFGFLWNKLSTPSLCKLA